MRIKKKQTWLLLLLGSIGVLDTLMLLLSSGGVNVGTILPGVLGAALIFSGWFQVFSRKSMPYGKTRRWVLEVRQIMFFLCLTGLISFFVVEGVIIYNSRPDPAVDVDYLIILGAGLNGEQLSMTLLERMQKGLDYLEAHPKVKVILSGGQGPGETISEAEAMSRFLVEHGVTNERILKEDQSTSTMENFRFSKELLIRQTSDQNSKKVAVITNDFHLFRSKILARRNGLIPVGIPSPTPWYIVPNVYLREYFAVVKSLIFDW